MIMRVTIQYHFKILKKLDDYEGYNTIQLQNPEKKIDDYEGYNTTSKS